MNAMSEMTEVEENTSITTLDKTVARLADLYGRVKETHWNLPGANSESHRLLEKFSFGILKHIDLAAERAGMVGGFVEGSSRVDRLGGFDAAQRPLPVLWPNELANAHRKVTDQVRAAIRRMISIDDLPTADVLTDVWRDLDLHIWLLESQINQQQKRN
jgi:DNA-binding ferritin-like protein